MHQHHARVIIFVTTLWFLLLYGLAATNAQDNGQDYFTVDKTVANYLHVVELNHVRTVPNLIIKGQVENAVNDIKYTLDRFPNHPMSLQQLGMVAQITKNTTLAVRYFERAIALFPQHALTWSQYGLFLLSINKVDAGIEHLKRSIEIEPNTPGGYAALAHGYMKKGDSEQAREAAKKARELGFSGKLPDGL